MRALRLLIAFVPLVALGCAMPASGPDTLDTTADEYVRLVLAVGRLDANYVDAYYGPPDWKAEASRGEPRPLPELRAIAEKLLERARSAPRSARREFLVKELTAVAGFLRIRGGERLSLAEEARVLYDIDVPRADPAAIAAARATLESLVPGEGPLEARVEAFRKRAEIPADRLPAVVRACVDESRKRTVALVALPPAEKFEVSFVKDRPWGAYNWYKGGFESLIEVNTDLPMQLGQVFGTIAHEGYPGHHTLNALVESRLVRGRGWREYVIYPLYSPSSLIAEGTADVAADVILTDEERARFEQETLAPIAGLAGLDFETYEKVARASRTFRRARSEAARLLLGEGRGEGEVIAYLVENALMTEARARKAIEFMKTYRAYEFTYQVGEDLVRSYVGEGPDRAARFFELLGTPATPSALREAVEASGRAP